MSFINILFIVLSIPPILMYTKVSTDYDLYGIKIALNDRFLVSADNLFLVWYIRLFSISNNSNCLLLYNSTTCDFVYSVVVSTSNNMSFIYNCIDFQGNNVVGLVTSNGTCSFHLEDERIVSNYSTQDNFVIAINGDGTGVYGFADDFMLFYQLFPTVNMTVWQNNMSISPRAVDISSNQYYAVLVGYCQSSVTVAVECGFVVQLNASLTCPYSTSIFKINTAVTYSWTDSRSVRLTTESRTYTPQSVMSVIFLYSLNDTRAPISFRQTGAGLMGYGKSVAWLDKTGHKAVILANAYSYSNYQWISSSVHVYDIQSDGFNDSTKPVLIYPNGLLDRLGNGIAILSASPNYYANTNTSEYVTSSLPCNRGTSRDYDGIELCYPHLAEVNNCSHEFYCPYGAVGEVAYSSFESIEQDQEYPESPENIVFDDILMQNIFSFNFKSIHCLLVSPITWVLVVMIIVGIVVAGMGVSEIFYPHHHSIRNQAKHIFRKIDLIGEGEIWIGGLITTAIIVLVISAYAFSNAYLHQYPIEELKVNNSLACDVTLRNAKFTTTTQKRSDPRRTTKESQVIFDLLDSQLFTLNIDLIQTAYTCADNFHIQRNNGYKTTLISITKCMMKYNDTILSLAIELPAHEINVKLVLTGIKTIGAIRIGLSAPSAYVEDGRFTAMKLNFASTFVSSSLAEVLAESTTFPIELTKIINRTDPLANDGLPRFSAIWSYSLTVNSDQVFTNESRYTFFHRTQTNISIIITQNIFYISNLQQPIARQTEVIFRCLLFTIVVLEVFGLIFLLVKLLIIPVFRILYNHCHKKFSRKNQIDSAIDLVVVTVDNKNHLNTIASTFRNQKPHRRWSTTSNVKR
ncbi:hypothetical protein I4U23_003825 [Adineta vaga]|nr:hypothetical protein I4U23_003825 [Adineta vaga]